MDFFDALNSQTAKEEFGSGRLMLSSKTSVFSLNRPHTSFSMVNGNSEELKINEASMYPKKGREARYVIAKEISFDLLVTIYEVNSKEAIALRITEPLGPLEIGKIKASLGKIHKSNFEMRAIGLQNANTSLVKSIEQIHKESKAKLIEVDLFGNMKRHIALDLKTGMSYDLLLQDKAYRAEELINTVTPEAFKAAQESKLKFV